jgi:ABC-type transporter Mla maintaining outer membrane lipid asymmetry ATPase subunit MlaF
VREFPAVNKVEMDEKLLAQTPSANRASTLGSYVEIRIENLYKSFGDRDVLDGINLEVHSGEMTALVGGSGSGKTTLLRHIIRLDHPESSGSVVATRKDFRIGIE